MEIQPDCSIRPTPGDFLSRFDDGRLLVAPQLAKFAQAYQLRSAEALAGYAGSFPEALALSLGWGEPAVRRAVQRLQHQMVANGVVSAADLDPPPPPAFGFIGRAR